MKEKGTYFIIGALSAFIFVVLVSATENQTQTTENDDQISTNHATTYAVYVPERIVFAGEEIPLEDYNIRERLDRELTVNTYFHSSTIINMKRAYRYMPIIESILSANNIPDDFKYLAIAESGLSNVVSSMGATGFWQFRKLAAKEQGLVVNNEVDERYHLEKSTKAACKYLKQLKEKFGTWSLAAAAYNMGPTGLKKQIERQKENSYFDLILNSETNRYLFRILALKTIFENPTKYGFALREEDMYQPVPHKIVVIDETIASWPKFCEENNITYKQLKLLNPWLRETSLTNTEKKEYKIKLPI